MASPVITSVTFEPETSEATWPSGGRRTVHVRLSDGVDKRLWSYYSDELAYTPECLLGLTEQAA